MCYAWSKDGNPAFKKHKGFDWFNLLLDSKNAIVKNPSSNSSTTTATTASTAIPSLPLPDPKL